MYVSPSHQLLLISHCHSIYITCRVKIRGSNLFFHQIISGTCPSNGYDSIPRSDVCALAANHHGYDIQQSRENIYELFADCSIEGWNDSSSTFSKMINILSHPWSINQVDDCKSNDDKCLCTSITPCFCSTKYYVDHDHENTHRKTQASGQFVVTWSLSLGGQESLLESSFLRAAFEQSVKDYINNDIRCSDDVNVKGAEFFGVQIPDPSTSDRRLKRAVSGNGKCKGDISKCKAPIKVKKKQETDDDDFRRRDLMVADASRVVKAFHTDDVFCNVFLSSTIFDAFKERLLTASTFSYNVDVDVINKLEGNLQLKYDVSFEPAKGDGLDQVEEVDGDADEPVPIESVCSASQCLSQRTVMRQIFGYFGLPWDENKHECLYQGINCNTDDLVTHIWLGELIGMIDMKHNVNMGMEYVSNDVDGLDDCSKSWLYWQDWWEDDSRFVQLFAFFERSISRCVHT